MTARAAGAGLRRLTSLPWRALRSSAALLFGVALLEELASGVPSGGAPDIERSLGLSHTATAVVLFLVPGVVQLVLDPVWMVLSERLGRPSLIRGGLAIMAASSLVAAVAPGPVTLAAALSIWGVATGAATSCTELTLIDRRETGGGDPDGFAGGAGGGVPRGIDRWPDRRARTMARWTLLGMVGDFAAPMLLGALALIAPGPGGWRIAFAVVGALLAAWALAAWLSPLPAATTADDSDNQPPLWQAAREALRDRVLIAWLFGTALCHLLDEILIVFASIYVRDSLGASPAVQNAMVGGFIAGGAAGLIGLDRLLARHGEHRLLIASGAACAVLFAGWLAAPSAWLAVVLMVPVGATAAPLYPLASALAYARCPERSSVVLVASHLFAPLTLALPYGLGWVADHAGVLAALALLAAQPVGLVVLAAVTAPRRTAAPPVTTADRDSRDSRTGDAP
ncbi:MAG TPA: MFS transporter [Kofleriaceae bacterium]|nr:MFS transporter [Kofleriaceae bacterium]